MSTLPMKATAQQGLPDPGKAGRSSAFAHTCDCVCRHPSHPIAPPRSAQGQQVPPRPRPRPPASQQAQQQQQQRQGPPVTAPLAVRRSRHARLSLINLDGREHTVYLQPNTWQFVDQALETVGDQKNVWVDVAERRLLWPESGRFVEVLPSPDSAFISAHLVPPGEKDSREWPALRAHRLLPDANRFVMDQASGPELRAVATAKHLTTNGLTGYRIALLLRLTKQGGALAWKVSANTFSFRLIDASLGPRGTAKGGHHCPGFSEPPAKRAHQSASGTAVAASPHDTLASKSVLIAPPEGARSAPSRNSPTSLLSGSSSSSVPQPSGPPSTSPATALPAVSTRGAAPSAAQHSTDPVDPGHTVASSPVGSAGLKAAGPTSSSDRARDEQGPSRASAPGQVLVAEEARRNRKGEMSAVATPAPSAFPSPLPQLGEAAIAEGAMFPDVCFASFPKKDYKRGETSNAFVTVVTTSPGRVAIAPSSRTGTSAQPPFRSNEFNPAGSGQESSSGGSGNDIPQALVSSQPSGSCEQHISQGSHVWCANPPGPIAVSGATHPTSTMGGGVCAAYGQPCSSGTVVPTAIPCGLPTSCLLPPMFPPPMACFPPATAAAPSPLQVLPPLPGYGSVLPYPLHPACTMPGALSMHSPLPVGLGGVDTALATASPAPVRGAVPPAPIRRRRGAVKENWHVGVQLLRDEQVTQHLLRGITACRVSTSGAQLQFGCSLSLVVGAKLKRGSARLSMRQGADVAVFVPAQGPQPLAVLLLSPRGDTAAPLLQSPAHMQAKAKRLRGVRGTDDDKDDTHIYMHRLTYTDDYVFPFSIDEAGRGPYRLALRFPTHQVVAWATCGGDTRGVVEEEEEEEEDDDEGERNDDNTDGEEWNGDDNGENAEEADSENDSEQEEEEEEEGEVQGKRPLLTRGKRRSARMRQSRRKREARRALLMRQALLHSAANACALGASAGFVDVPLPGTSFWLEPTERVQRGTANDAGART